MERSKSEPVTARMVRVIHRDDRWIVQVLEETGTGTYEREFMLKEHAEVYASGQRKRLGLNIGP